MNIAILASGEGTNAQNIIEHLRSKNYNFIIYTNNPSANVIKRAKNCGVNYFIIDNKDLLSSLRLQKIDFIVLAGYLRLIPSNVIDVYKKRIINIHPSLLPKYGGKGMWGTNVHKLVIENKEAESGITIHYVSERYDEGEIIEQHRCEVLFCDTVEILQKKISLLEREYYPKCVERILFTL